VAGVLRDHCGGILGLLRLLTEHGEAIEYELLTIGKHIDDLGTRRLSWRDLLVVVKQAPPQGALHRALDPEGWGWTVDSYLLAADVDYAAAAAWQRAGDKRKKRPDPILRPGQKKKRGRNLTELALKSRGVDRG
jgi:hypothetical protein